MFWHEGEAADIRFPVYGWRSGRKILEMMYCGICRKAAYDENKEPGKKGAL